MKGIMARVNLGRVAGFGAVGAVTGMLLAGMGTAAYPLDAATAGYTAEMTSAIGTALPIGGAVLAFFVGWKILKRIVRG